MEELDYERFPSKLRHCHGDGHFYRTCKKKAEEESSKEKGEKWTEAQKKSTKKKVNRSKGKRGEMGSSSNPTRQKQNENEIAMKEVTSQNNFEVLRNPEEQALPALEEGEVQQTQGLIRGKNKDSAKQDFGSPVSGSISPRCRNVKKETHG